MSRLTNQLTVVIAGLRGPGLSSADTALITQAKVDAQAAANAAAISAALTPAARSDLGVMTAADQAKTTYSTGAAGGFLTSDTTVRAFGVEVSSAHVPAGKTFTDLVLTGLRAPTGATQVRLRAWRRPDDSAQPTAGPGISSDDVSVGADAIYTLSSLSLTVGTEGAAAMALPWGLVMAEGYRFVLSVETLDASGALLNPMIRANGVNTGRSWSRNAGGAWAAFASPNAIAFSARYRTNVADIARINRAGLATTTSGLAVAVGLLGSIHDQPDESYAIASTTDWTAGGMYEIAYAYDAGAEIKVGQAIKALGTRLALIENVTTRITVTVYERPLTSANINAAPVQSDDVQVAAYSGAPAAFGLPAPTTAVVNMTSGSPNLAVVSGTLVAGQVLGGVSNAGIVVVTTGAAAGGTAIASRPAAQSATGATVTIGTMTDAVAVLPAMPPIRKGYSYIARWGATDVNGVQRMIVTGFRSQPTADQRKVGWYKNSTAWVNGGANSPLGRSITTTPTVGSVAQDALALAQQIQAGLASGGGLLRLFKNTRSTATRIWGVQAPQVTTQSGNTTYELLIETAQIGVKVSEILCNSGNPSISSSALNIVSMSVSSAPNMNPTSNNNGATWVDIPVAGGKTVAIAAGQKRSTLDISDFVACPTVPRDDGRPGGVYCLRVCVSNTGDISIPIMGRDSGPDFSGAATRTDGGAVRIRSMPGNFASAATASGFTTTTNSGASPICGIEYEAEGRVITVSAMEDSIGQGQQDSTPNDGWVSRLARYLNNTAGIACEYAQFSWTGRSTGQALAVTREVLAATRPDGTGLHIDANVTMGGTGNDTGAGDVTVTDAIINNLNANLWERVRLYLDRGILPILYTWGPYGYNGTGPYGGFHYGASDAKRVAHNARIMAARARGLIVLDFAAVLGSDGLTGDGGQRLMNNAYRGDVVHPNAAAYNATHTQQTVPQLIAAIAAA